MTLATVKKAKTVAKSTAKVVVKKPAGRKAVPTKLVKTTAKKLVVKSVSKAPPKVVPKAKVAAKAIKAIKTGAKPKVAAKSAGKAIAKTPAKAAVKAPAKVPTKKITVKESVKVPPKAIVKPSTPSVTKVPAAPAARSPVRSVAKMGEPVVIQPTPRPPPKATRGGPLLTEAELLKQPKSDYMSQDQLNFFKNRLKELQTQLRLNAGATTENLRELAVAPDPADRATLEEEHALELRARDRERKLLKKVEGVLALIESGEYGYCEETGEPIGLPRLLARPTATLTIEAQERRELKQKMYGE